ncbi:MAG: hypothetical protein PHD51_02030 [Patescibacteria group bacterium]|nr:hypothetical protein [Patescibacteria group bacterium]MDD5490361.1 hypothetical protein [Patescibacteria group bacterium]
MNQKEKIVSWILFGIFLIIMIPWGEISNRIKENQKIREEKIAEAGETIIQAEKLFERVQNNVKKESYTAEIFAQDIYDLRKTESELKYLEGYMTLPQGNLYYKKSIAYVNYLADTSLDRLKKNYEASMENGNNWWKMYNDIAIAREKLEIVPRVSDGILKTIGWWYLCFIPFAFLILCCRLFYSERYSLKEELILAPQKIMLASIVWILGLSFYPDGTPTLEKKINSLLSKMFPDKLPWGCSKEEVLLAEEIARVPLERIDKVVEEATKVPELAKTQARTAITVTSLFSTLLSPIFAYADDVITTVFSGSGNGNAMSFQYEHSEKSWQTNAAFQLTGNSINLLGGPRFTVNGFSFKPEIGGKISTEEKLSLNTGVAGFKIIGEKEGVNIWSINKYFLNFKEKAQHALSQEFALHYFFTTPIAAGFGICNNWTPFAQEKDRGISGTLGPRLLFKISKNLPMLEAALGLDFLNQFQPKEFRLMAFFAF